jgi:putative sterol carrier protein
MAAAPSRKVLTSAAEVPVPLVDEVIVDMASRMEGTEESRRCAGLSFAFEILDLPLKPARYAVGEAGSIILTRSITDGATFIFRAHSEVFDEVLRGHASALGAILSRRIHMHGSLLHVRGLMRMMPAVNRAYADARDSLVDRHRHRYDFRF